MKNPSRSTPERPRGRAEIENRTSHRESNDTREGEVLLHRRFTGEMDGGVQERSPGSLLSIDSPQDNVLAEDDGP
jgi:hypothetical protein